MVVLASISARLGSKGVPRKNLRPLAGKTLVQRAIELAKSTPSITDILVSSDSHDILELAREYDCFIDKRPDNLADDSTSLHMVTKYNLELFESLHYRPSCIVQLSPTCPFLLSNTIERGIKKVLDEKFSSSISLSRIEHSHPYRARLINSDGTFRNFVTSVDVESSRFHSRQDLPEMWCTSGGLYIRDYNTLKFFDGQSFGFGSNPYGLKVSDVESINIDNQTDWDFAEFIALKKGL